MKERLTAAAAELGDVGRWRVDMAGALVSPLISAPRLELVLRGLAIVIYMVFSCCWFPIIARGSVFSRFLYSFRRSSHVLGFLSDAAWHGIRGGQIPPFPINQYGLQGYHSRLGSVSPK